MKKYSVVVSLLSVVLMLVLSITAYAGGGVVASNAQVVLEGKDWWLMSDGVLTINSDEGMRDWSYTWAYDRLSSPGAPPIDFDVTRVKKVVISEGVSDIYENIFSNNSSLESFFIPSSVNYVSSSAFVNCTNLTEIIVDEDNKMLASLDGVLYSKDLTILIAYPIGKTDTQYNIPHGVTSVQSFAFDTADALINITIPNSVKDIGFYSFGNLKNLESASIPNSVVDIDSAAFAGCENLPAINVAEDNEYYASVDGVLYSKDMTQLFAYPPGKKDKEYVIPEGITTIKAYAFIQEFKFRYLESITFPASLANYLNVAEEASGGSSINTLIIDSTFLKEINVAEGNPTYTSIDGVLYNKELTEIISYPNAKTDKVYTVPDSVEHYYYDYWNPHLEKIVVSRDTAVFSHVDTSNISIVYPDGTPAPVEFK